MSEEKAEVEKILENIYVPSWVRKGYESIYKRAYLECRADPVATKLSSTKRKEWIINRGKVILDQLMAEAKKKVEEEKLNKEKENGQPTTEGSSQPS